MYFSQNIVAMVKEKMRLAVHVDEKCIANVTLENLKGTDHLGHLLRDRSIILKRILKKQAVN
jgi:hypothetical protein